MQTVENSVTGGVTVFDMGFALIQLMGEELFKVSVLLIAMGLIYYLTKNRKSALVFGAFASMMLFGLIHLTSYGNDIYQCIFIIGVGSIFHLFPYIKTKNVFNSYIVHIMLDMSTMLLILIGSH